MRDRGNFFSLCLSICLLALLTFHFPRIGIMKFGGVLRSINFYYTMFIVYFPFDFHVVDYWVRWSNYVDRLLKISVCMCLCVFVANWNWLWSWAMFFCCSFFLFTKFNRIFLKWRWYFDNLWGLETKYTVIDSKIYTYKWIKWINFWSPSLRFDFTIFRRLIEPHRERMKNWELEKEREMDGQKMLAHIQTENEKIPPTKWSTFPTLHYLGAFIIFTPSIKNSNKNHTVEVDSVVSPWR